MVDPSSPQTPTLIKKMKRPFFFLLGILPVLLFGQPSGERLKDLAPPGFAVGGVLHGYDANTSFNNLAYREIARREFNAITGTAYLGWNSWNWNTDQPVDYGFVNVVDWSIQNDKRFHGHALLYPLSSKARWGDSPNERVRDLVEKHTRHFARVRKGKVWLWDVANEVMADNGGAMDSIGLRTYWRGANGLPDYNQPVREYHAYGSSYYVERAFQIAREEDPNAILILNEYGVGADDPNDTNQKADRFLNYAVYLKSIGVPIDGVGFQMHWSTEYTPVVPSVANIKANIKRFTDNGLSVYFTELDASPLLTQNPGPCCPGTSTPNQQQLNWQYAMYQNVMQAALESPGCESVLLWDFADNESWLHPNDQDTFDDPSDDVYGYPTPFWYDDHNTAKGAYYAMQSALSNHASTYTFGNAWDYNSGLLHRNGQDNGDGTWTPLDSVGLHPPAGWSSMRWRLERQYTGVYRIFCLWDGGAGYLTRKGDNGSATSGVHFTSNGSYYNSQLWRFEQAVDPNAVRNDIYRIRNLWDEGSGYLTRDGRYESNCDCWVPLSTVSLHGNNPDWASQYWRVGRLE